MVQGQSKVEGSRDQDVGILTEILNKFKAASNGLKRAMVVPKEETNETVERERSWAEAKVKEKAEIFRVNDESKERERAEAKERVREKNNTVQRVATEPMQRPRKERYRDQRLRQGLRLRLISKKMRRRRGRQGQRRRLRLRRGKWHGPRPKKGRR